MTNVTVYQLTTGIRNRAAAATEQRLYIADISSFHCFCDKAFYISNFKDFNTGAPAC
jgi:hypothetical protein